MRNFGRFCTTSDFDREYLRNEAKYPISERLTNYELEIEQGLLTHTRTGTGVPQKHDDENLKFVLKFSVCAPITSRLVGIFSPNFSRPRDELWSTNEKGFGAHIDPPELLVYCKLTQVHTPRGSFRSHSPAAIAARGISTTQIDFPLGLAAPGGLTSGSATHF